MYWVYRSHWEKLSSGQYYVFLSLYRKVSIYSDLWFLSWEFCSFPDIDLLYIFSDLHLHISSFLGTKLMVLVLISKSNYSLLIFKNATDLKKFFFNWSIITLQNFVVFCQTSTWIGHRYTYVPSLLNLPSTSHPIAPF